MSPWPSDAYLDNHNHQRSHRRKQHEETDALRRRQRRDPEEVSGLEEASWKRVEATAQT